MSSFSDSFLKVDLTVQGDKTPSSFINLGNINPDEIKQKKDGKVIVQNKPNAGPEHPIDV